MDANLGSTGEDVAAGYLKKKGWLILDRNISRKFGEIDILARDSEGVLVFVEVKTMRTSEGSLSPEDNLTHSKLKKMQRIAQAFANSNPQLIQSGGWRIDLLAISIRDCQSERIVDIKHYENL